MKRMIRISLMAMTAMFVCSTVADAQFGKLKGLANKAKQTVSKDAVADEQPQQQSSQQMVQSAQSDYLDSHPAAKERDAAEKAGGMDKYLGLDQTDNGRILWKYAGMSQTERTSSYQVKNGFSAADQIVNVLRYLKGNTETFSHYSNSATVLDLLNNQIPQSLSRAAEKRQGGSPLPTADIDALKSELARVKQLYLSQSGAREETAGERQEKANAQYVADIVRQNYLLNDLTDKNRQAKAVADYKAKVTAKIKQQLAPTKILGTYSTSFAWQTLPIFQMPELKEKYNSVQEMQFKTFYEKGGKYYVVKSAFRQAVAKGDVSGGAKPLSDYWPGLETPVEVPADKIQGKF